MSNHRLRLRDNLGLTDTKYGCGLALCGCCTVLIDGSALRSCVTPVFSVLGKEITTIAGLSEEVEHPVQKGVDGGKRAPMLADFICGFASHS